MRRKVKAFLHTLVNSVVPQNTYYAHILRQRLVPSFIYYIALLAIVSCLAVGIVLVRLAENSSEKIDRCLQYSMKTIPPDYSLHIQNGILSTNQAMPLFIWFNCNDKINLLGVVDERATRNDIYSYNAQALSTGSELILRYKSYLFTFPYQKYLPQLRADKTTVVNFMNRGLDVVKMYFPLLTVSIILITPLVLFILNVVYLFVSSFCVLLFFKLMKRHYAYRTVLHVGAHSSTLPILTSLLFLLFPVHITSTLILFFFLIFVFQLVGVYEGHYVEASSHHK